MYQSHESYSSVGLGSERTNEVVKFAKELSPSVYGAKITGGGSGGTVCILAHGLEGKESVHRLHKALCAKYKSKLKLFES
jgi:galactokinase